MINVTALRPVSAENMNVVSNVSNVLTKSSQNIKIEYSKQADLVPLAVERIALRMLKLDSEIRDFLNELRILFSAKREDFHFSLRGISNEGKRGIVDLCQNLYGVIAEVRYCEDCEMLHGRLVLSSKALMFINGQYMEIAIRKVVGDVLAKLEKKHGKQFKLYENTKVATIDGKLKNEFDLIIENVTDALIYVIEIKSGKQFRDYDKLARIGHEYGIVPNRLLLVQNYLTTEQMETIEYFCEYYCANLEQDNLEQKIITMIENDL